MEGGGACDGRDVVSLLVRTARVAFEEINPRLEEAAHTLGAGRWTSS